MVSQKKERWSNNPTRTKKKMSNTRKKLMRDGKIKPPLKLSEEKYREIKELYIKGEDIKKISYIVKCSCSAIYRCVKKIRQAERKKDIRVFKNTLKKLSESDRGYIAGILDGEGSISISLCTTIKKPNKKYYSASLVVGNQDKELIYFLHSKLKLKTKIYNYQGERKDMIIKLYGKDMIIEFLEFILPYSHSEKTKERSDIMLKFCVAKTQEKREYLYKKLKAQLSKNSVK